MALFKQGIALGLVLSSTLSCASTLYMRGIQEPAWGIQNHYNFLVKVKFDNIEQEYHLTNKREYTQFIPLGDTQCKLLLAGEEDYNKTTSTFDKNNSYMLLCKNYATNKSVSMLGSFEKDTELSINHISITMEQLN